MFGTSTLGGTVAVQRDGVAVCTTPAALDGSSLGSLVSAARRVVGTDALVFPGTFGQCDLRYDVTQDAVKETVVVPTRAAAGPGNGSFLLDVAGGTPTVQPDGSVAVVRPDGTAGRGRVTA